MRVRLALTLFAGLVLALLAIPAGAQPADSSTGVDDALHVGRPRAAIMSVFHSASEAFLAFDGGAEHACSVHSNGTQGKPVAQPSAVYP